MKHSKGFTLIELLVVISIIGVLSSVVLAAVTTARSKGQVAAGLTFSDHTKSALYPTDDATPYVYLDFTGAVQGNAASIVSNGPTGGSGTSLNANISFPADITLHKIGQYMQFPVSYPGGAAGWTGGGSPSLATAIMSGNFTMALWFNPNGCSGGCNVSYPLLFNDGSAGYDTFIYYTNGTIKAGVESTTGLPNLITTGYALPSTTQWSHLALSVKKSGGSITGALYINGNVVGTNTITQPSPLADETLFVGGACCGFGMGSAQYDDVAFYGQTLLSDEVHKLYVEGLPTHSFAMSK